MSARGAINPTQTPYPMCSVLVTQYFSKCSTRSNDATALSAVHIYVHSISSTSPATPAVSECGGRENKMLQTIVKMHKHTPQERENPPTPHASHSPRRHILPHTPTRSSNLQPAFTQLNMMSGILARSCYFLNADGVANVFFTDFHLREFDPTAPRLRLCR